jgi:hypothetical protein
VQTTFLAVVLAAVTMALPPAQLDHIVVAVRSLDEGVAQFEQLTGVKAGAGGKHPGRGTENALVSLGGGSYLEIIAPQAAATLSKEDEGMRALAHLTIVDWAVRVGDVDAAVAALKAAGFTTSLPQPGARLTPAGERLDWMTFGLTDQALSGAPFFIRWSPNTRHPSTTAAEGCLLDRLRVHDPRSGRLSAALGALGVADVTIDDGTAQIEATLTCGSRHATLTSAPAK